MASVENIRPLADRVIVKVIQREEKTPGGLFIPTTAKDENLVWKAEVLAVGPGKVLENGSRREADFKRGDIVFLGKYLGKEMTLEDGKIVFVKFDDIDAVLDES